MKADVKAEWISAGEKALLAAADGWSTDLTKLEVEDSARGQSLRWAFTSAILAAVIPLIQKEEREACISDLTDDGHHIAVATLRARGEP